MVIPNSQVTTQPSSEPPRGILLIDKPTGMTSHDVIAIVRKKMNVKRVGHAGTLDPLATGLLIVLVSREYTKLQAQFLKQDKVYECTARFGIVSDTYDFMGAVQTSATWALIADITKEKIQASLEIFRGPITQAVPAYSAVKVKGQKLYSLARKHELDMVLPQRQIEVFEFELVDFIKDEESQTLTAKFRIHCSSGTYVRSLIHDLGEKLGVGAVVKELRRVKIGTVKVDRAVSLEENLLQQLLPSL